MRQLLNKLLRPFEERRRLALEKRAQLKEERLRRREEELVWLGEPFQIGPQIARLAEEERLRERDRLRTPEERAIQADTNSRLLEAAKLGDIGGLRAAIAEDADNIGEAFMQCARNDRMQAAGYLLDHGAGAQLPKGILFHAAYGGHVEIVRLLLGKGANPNEPDEHYYSEELDPVLGGNSDTEERAEYPCFTDEEFFEAIRHFRGEDRFPIRAALLRGHVEVAKILFEAGAMFAHLGRRELFQGIEAGGVEMGRLLLEHAPPFTSLRPELAEAAMDLEILAEAEAEAETETDLAREAPA